MAPLPLPINMPCGNQHSCCMRRAPNSSSLPTSGRTQRPNVHEERVENPAQGMSPQLVRSITRHPVFSSYEALSTVLRI